MSKKKSRKASGEKSEDQAMDAKDLTQPLASDSEEAPTKRFDPDQAFRKLKKRIDNS
ncbi:MAG: hypothetical protein R8G66_07795 [Cytophagales bacterium]|nr:hypothetical protein [Cytophagales bacterium]